jgi:tRNA threonylcarbamoyl adenosine modification protein YjeE
MKELVIHDEAATRALAQRLAPVVRGGTTIGLSGGLGAGKTTLVRFLVESLGGDPKEVASPSYTLQHEYHISRADSGAGARKLTIEHWDLYRLSSLPDELYEAPSSSVVRLIEWPERCPELKDALDGTVTIGLCDDGSRSIRLDGVCAF